MIYPHGGASTGQSEETEARLGRVTDDHPDTSATASTAMVSTVDARATEVGLDLLRKGGSAADAAVGANAALAVIAPNMCGMGGDAWALVHNGAGPPVALDSAGFAGSGADAERVRAEAHEYIPLRDNIASVTVPGAVDGWLALHERFGRLPMTDVLGAAIELAENGFEASPLLAEAAPSVADTVGNTDIPGDLASGDVVGRPGSARALRALVERGRDGFYGGEFGEGLLELGENHITAGAPEFTADDLATPIARWVDPLVVEAFGHLLWTVPPSSQGYLTLAGAWIAESLGLPHQADHRWAHLLVEAASQAGYDRLRVLHDRADGHALIDPSRLALRLDAIDPARAGNVAPPASPGDTTFLCAVDADRMGVSLINSNASGFGAHLVAGTTGIFLQDRGMGFSLEAGHPAEYAPGRRPPHTLSPALVTRVDGSLKQVIGTMGGDSQPQILIQLLARTLGLGQLPGTAIGAARWTLAPDNIHSGFATWRPGSSRSVIIERASAGWHEALAAMGHSTMLDEKTPGRFGHAHIIETTTDGSLRGAADPRALVGQALGL